MNEAEQVCCCLDGKNRLIAVNYLFAQSDGVGFSFAVFSRMAIGTLLCVLLPSSRQADDEVGLTAIKDKQ
jgi:hypothetical protein